MYYMKALIGKEGLGNPIMITGRVFEQIINDLTVNGVFPTRSKITAHFISNKDKYKHAVMSNHSRKGYEYYVDSIIYQTCTQCRKTVRGDLGERIYTVDHRALSDEAESVSFWVCDKCMPTDPHIQDGDIVDGKYLRRDNYYKYYLQAMREPEIFVET